MDPCLTKLGTISWDIYAHSVLQDTDPEKSVLFLDRPTQREKEYNEKRNREVNIMDPLVKIIITMVKGKNIQTYKLNACHYMINKAQYTSPTQHCSLVHFLQCEVTSTTVADLKLQYM